MNQPLKKLSVADCKLRLNAAALFDCLGTNETITFIDIRYGLHFNKIVSLKDDFSDVYRRTAFNDFE